MVRLASIFLGGARRLTYTSPSGKDSFFKSHKDTPRSERMFGSLVVIFPAPHEGGALVLREDGREWTFDYAAELASVLGVVTRGDGMRRCADARGWRERVLIPLLPWTLCPRERWFRIHSRLSTSYAVVVTCGAHF